MGQSTFTSAYLMNDGTVKVSGYNSSGQLGLGHTSKQTTIVTIPNLNNVKQIACATDYTMFLLNDGTVMASGFNTGQFSLSNVSIPTKVNITDVKHIACGSSHTLFLMNDGTVKSIGLGTNGQLGNNASSVNGTPYTLPLSGVKQVACGSRHSLFLMNDGTVYSCGSNEYHQLGYDTNGTNSIEIKKINISNVKQIAGGSLHSLFLLEDGSLLGSGYSNYGQLGNRVSANILVTVKSQNVKQIACGTNHSIFLMNDGTATTLGYNYYGQLGNGSTTDSSDTNRILSITNIKEVATGAQYTKVLTNDGKVYGMGVGDSGELAQEGTSWTVQKNLTPIDLKLSNVRSINELELFRLYMSNNTPSMEKKTLDNKLEVNITITGSTENLKSYMIEELSMEKPIYIGEINVPSFPYEFKDNISLNSLKEGINKLKITFITVSNNREKIELLVFKGKNHYSVFNKAIILKDLKNIKINKMVLKYNGSGKIFPFIKESNSSNYEFINNKELKALLADSTNTKIGFIMDKDAELNSYGVAWI